MNEDKFLKARREREEVRTAQRHELSQSEGVLAREEFALSLGQLQHRVAKCVEASASEDVDEKGRTAFLDEATSHWREMQALIQHASDALRLPAHEIRNANNTLDAGWVKVQEAKNRNRMRKRFTFTSKNRARAAGLPSEPPQEESMQESNEAAAPSSEVVTDPALTYADMEDTTVFVKHGKAAFVRRLKRCTVFVLPISGSCFISDCEDCTVYAACHQMRIKSCKNTSVYVWCASIPVIEACRGMSFGGYDAWRGLTKTDPSVLDTDAKARLAAKDDLSHDSWVAGVGELRDLDHAHKSFTVIDDFDWLRQQQSPHFRVLDADSFVTNDTQFAVPQ